MAYAPEDYLDLVTTTLRNLERMTWADLVVDNQQHIAMNQIMKNKRTMMGGGRGPQFNVRLFSNNAARNVLLGETDNPTTADTQKTGTTDWRTSETYWAIEERVIAMNSGPAQIVNLVTTSRVDALTDFAELMETNFWSKPDSSTDKVKPHGVPYWITTTGYTTTFGFNGGRPVGFTDVGGLDPNTYSRWKNGTAKFVNVNKDDLIKLWREAATKCNFMPPVAGPHATSAPDWAYYTDYAVLGELESVLESQNMNLGSDVASQDGKTIFRQTAVTWVPWFDNNSGTTDTTNPVYGINWSKFKLAYLEGEYMKETEVRPHPFKHRTLVMYTDCTYDYITNDRRSHFVLSK